MYNSYLFVLYIKNVSNRGACNTYFRYVVNNLLCTKLRIFHYLPCFSPYLEHNQFLLFHQNNFCHMSNLD